MQFLLWLQLWPLLLASVLHLSSKHCLATNLNETAWLSNFSLGLVSIFGEVIVPGAYLPGQAFRVQLDFQTELNSTCGIFVQLSANDSCRNLIDFVDLNVTWAGANLPGVSTWANLSVISKSNNSETLDIAFVDLGLVSNYFNTDADDANKLVLQAVGRIRVAPLQNLVTYSCMLSVTVSSQGRELYSSQQPINASVTATEPSSLLTIRNAINSLANITVNTVGQDNTSARIGSHVNVSLIFTVPNYLIGPVEFLVQNFSKENGASEPTNVSSWYSMSDLFRLDSVGINLAGLSHETNFRLRRSSSAGTVQMNNAFLDEFIVQSIDLTARRNYRTEADNQFTVTVSFQIADDILTDNATIFRFVACIRVISYIAVLNKSVQIFRDGAESVVTSLQVNTSMSIAQQQKWSITSSDVISITVRVACESASTAEMQDPVLFIHVPAYLRLVGAVNVSYASGSVCTQATAGGGIKFVFSSTIFFNEVAALSFQMKFNSSQGFPNGRSISKDVIIWEMTYRMHPRAGNQQSGRWLRRHGYQKLIVESDSLNAASCSESLGMNDTIRDCQLSSFMSTNASHDATQARPNANGWIPHVRGGSYGSFRYVTVLFGSLKRLTKISVHAGADGNRATCLNLYSTLDGRAFSFQGTYYIENQYTGHIAVLVLDRTILLRGIRIGICNTTMSADRQISMKFDLFGCNASESDVEEFDACQMHDFADRSINRSVLFRNNSVGTLYYCDFIPIRDATLLTGTNRCFKTDSENPRKWQYLGPQVSNILGFDAQTNTLYGSTSVLPDKQGRSSSAIVYSVDSESAGDTAWAYWNPIGYNAMLMSGSSFREAQIIEWRLIPGVFDALITGQRCTEFSFGNWSACYDGLYYTEERVLDWNNCPLCDA